MDLSILYSPWFTSMAPSPCCLLGPACSAAPCGPASTGGQACASPCWLQAAAPWGLGVAAQQPSSSAGRQAGTQGRRPYDQAAPVHYGLRRCGQRTAVRLHTGDGAADRGRRYGAVLGAAAIGRGRAAAVVAHGGAD